MVKFLIIIIMSSLPFYPFFMLYTVFGKAKGREGKGKEKGGREERGEGRERIKFFLSLVWLVREKWRQTHLIGGSHHKYSLIFLPIWEERMWWAMEEFVSFIFLSFTPIPPNQTKDFISFPSLSFLFFPNPS